MAIGSGGIGLQLSALGYGGRGELRSTGGVWLGIPFASHGWGENPTPFKLASIALLASGAATAVICTIVLLATQHTLDSKASTAPRRE